MDLHDAIRTNIAAVVDKRGAASVAKLLGVHRPTLYSYLAKTCRPGTRALIEQRADVVVMALRSTTPG
jgi:DNA-binding phage protein